MRRILCLDLPNWPIQRLGVAHEGAILLHARDPRRGEVIVAASEAAWQRGVRLAMPLAEAAALAQRGTPAPLIRRHEAAADLAELARLAAHCERFSPLVGWKTVEGSKFKVPGSQLEDSVRSAGNLEPGTWNCLSPDCLFLDVTGIEVLFGGEEPLLKSVITETARFGYQARAAIAGTIAAAWSGAKYGDCTLDALRLPPETRNVLQQLGITQLEELLALPRAGLRARFGELVLWRVDQLLGTAAETIVPYRLPPKFAAERLLDYPVERRDAIEQIIEELIGRVAADLAARREGAVQLACRLDCAPGRPLLLEVGLFRPSADPQHLWEVLRMRLEQAKLPGAVGRATLEARLTAPLENRQGELFAGGEQRAERHLALLIDRYSSRLGADRVLSPQLTPDPLPERAVRYRAGGRKGSKLKALSSKFRTQGPTKNGEPGTGNFALMRPLLLYSPPLALAVVAIAPDGPPASFELQGRRLQVVCYGGPERIETGWWRGASVRRDYWRVAVETGQRFWLFRRLSDGAWFLHGTY